jgi:hypothetical protein
MMMMEISGPRLFLHSEDIFAVVSVPFLSYKLPVKCFIELLAEHVFARLEEDVYLALL